MLLITLIGVFEPRPVDDMTVQGANGGDADADECRCELDS
jgi:hypothetical protein